MAQSSSWEANRFSASQEIPHILLNPNVHYCIQNSPPPVPILSQINPFHAPLSHFFKIHFNIIFPTMPGSSKWALSLKFPHQNPVCTSPLPHLCYMPRPSHLLDLITHIIFGEYRPLTSLLHSLFHSLVNMPLLGPSTLLSTLLSPSD